MNELDQLRAEADQLKNAIRVSNVPKDTEKQIMIIEINHKTIIEMIRGLVIYYYEKGSLIALR